MMMKENNKLIAEFMGMENERHSDGRYLFTTDIDELKGTDTRFWEELYFNVSWDWLMPVVRKCKESVSYEDSILYHNIEDALLSRIDREDTYIAVVEYIKWYNKKNRTDDVVYPFKEGDDYWTIEDGEIIWSCWDYVSEEIHDKNPNKEYFITKESAINHLKK